MNNCPNGVVYESLSDANIEVSKQGFATGIQLIAVQCDLKHHWHIVQFNTRNKHMCVSCTSRSGAIKRTFKDMKSAIDFTLNWNHNSDTKMRPYKCPEGNGWHLSTIQKDENSN